MLDPSHLLALPTQTIPVPGGLVRELCAGTFVPPEILGSAEFDGVVGLWLITLVTLVLALVIAHVQESRPFAALAKVGASCAFIGLAYASGVPFGPWGRSAMAALWLSWLGDLLLIPNSPRWFLAGLASFLLAHLAFAWTFWLRGVDEFVLINMWLALGLLALFVLWKLDPHLGTTPRGPVRAYALGLAAMVAFAAGHSSATGDPTFVIAALMFFVSDLSVAWDRFVQSSPLNKLWGLPLYYGAQALFALNL